MKTHSISLTKRLVYYSILLLVFSKCQNTKLKYMEKKPDHDKHILNKSKYIQDDRNNNIDKIIEQNDISIKKENNKLNNEKVKFEQNIKNNNTHCNNDNNIDQDQKNNFTYQNQKQNDINLSSPYKLAIGCQACCKGNCCCLCHFSKFFIKLMTCKKEKIKACIAEECPLLVNVNGDNETNEEIKTAITIGKSLGYLSTYFYNFSSFYFNLFCTIPFYLNKELKKSKYQNELLQCKLENILSLAPFYFIFIYSLPKEFKVIAMLYLIFIHLGI